MAHANAPVQELGRLRLARAHVDAGRTPIFFGMTTSS